ncbi:capsular biosynthesis protein [Candidatus Woesebacteria bacterium RIFCSPHIGHO2_01_FULL_39_32]|uniref:Capsular biosynthesis protein n=1 Tax=Candidatus Woesebacteria bacterium RIFCSPLOWO2_01_FULL_39_25 TaxID=1802521 RepID=A0A1F8BLG1_9BACT|nr:MAG: capsular biosynthesis protein [Candidatus Woesebacteria bacterium GWB1_37_5]OGM25373.1 MAG: capsular biosynthesis protein [Candidatus Woesebacteria bacterium RIFCSPHIGHO2_01_FULL_39_32]OGM38481.1 MAG: capsular biosynthesis protein [Candidatus Woesebacteria bacterium RIFCSPHIGHO2_12_FULL_38_11]OGM64904.1 MAG: capsular biosynthesis protein [Candidatus Woesebacteria bacterium RIFCSPLOWO2_01_FULL_39_25]
MRICIDLDGVICEVRRKNQSYEDVKPLPGAIEKIQELKSKGHYIIISTSRHMKTTDGNVNKILAKVGEITLTWLRKHKIPFDEINFGKPYAHIYIDDKAVRFSGWKKIRGDGGNLPLKKEDKEFKVK